MTYTTQTNAQSHQSTLSSGPLKRRYISLQNK